MGTYIADVVVAHPTGGALSRYLDKTELLVATRCVVGCVCMCVCACVRVFARARVFVRVCACVRVLYMQRFFVPRCLRALMLCAPVGPCSTT